jgi:2-polyprenyl-3-methyl-5-hydroxy-6-metoxy-1,4-benzoquinol methylase/uncharacterized protein YbaR (Trm112 family)
MSESSGVFSTPLCGRQGIVLCCPKDASALRLQSDGALSCESGHSYPVIDGIPVLLRDDIEQTMDLARASMARARNEFGSIDQRNPDFYLESLGVSELEKQIAVDLAHADGGKVDPVVSVLVAATNGIAYKHLIGRMSEYPIPEIRLPDTPDTMDKVMLDVGCSWGRWSIAAARKGYRVVGIDPSLSALMAAKRVARQMDLAVGYICADARHLPFCSNTFDAVFSYSVIQHFSKADAKQTFAEIGRVLKPLGSCLVQMPNYFGARSLLHLMRRRFAEGTGFDVRYWSVNELRRIVESRIGPANFSVHCFFGLGLEPADSHLMPLHVRWSITLSERLRSLSKRMPLLTSLADSVYIAAAKKSSP